MQRKRMDNNKPQEELKLTFNLPNVVTSVRIVLAIVIAWLLLQEGSERLIAGILLVVAWATDGLDGLLARRLNQATLAGSLFDLIADRLIMTSVLIISIAVGLWAGTVDFMPFNPYPYVIIVVAADIALMTGVVTFIWKRRRRKIEFPPPTQIARITFSVQMITLVAGILGILPGVVTAVLMYLSIIFTLIATFSYVKKGGYVFTR